MKLIAESHGSWKVVSGERMKMVPELQAERNSK